jgi:alkylhydroperoxidase/carboxymuconolactone decarboxylase family protein YurZ
LRDKKMGTSLISNSFMTFMKEAPEHAKTWGEMVQGLAKASALNKKTEELAYLSVLAALNMISGIPFHVKTAKNSGATRDEIISAILVGLPAAGHSVTQALPAAIEAYDN